MGFITGWQNSEYSYADFARDEDIIAIERVAERLGLKLSMTLYYLYQDGEKHPQFKELEQQEFGNTILLTLCL
jgi:hypothetical protein